MNQPTEPPVPSKRVWQQAVANYQRPEVKRSLWQLANSLLPYFALWYLMVRSLEISYWLTLALAFPAAGFMMRIFIIFHDCGHRSFFMSERANAIVGFFTGLLTFTAFYQWTHDHAVHHATAGNLDRRGVGDVKVLTVKEYLALPAWKRFGYRCMRNPLLMFTVGATLVFLVAHRFTHKGSGRRERYSVYWTNLALLVLAGLASLTIGFKTYLLVQLPIVVIGTSLGVWLFYVQHQFEDVYWARQDRWDYARAALLGSSYYKLPAILQWFSGNIGFHHIHHLSPRIPNYFLAQCHREHAIFQAVRPLTILSSLKSLSLRLYDEDQRKLVGYAALRMYQRSAQF